MCRAKSVQSSPTLCNPVDYSPPGSSVHGILHARILEWVAMPSSRASSQPRDRTHSSYVSCTGRWILYPCATWEARLIFKVPSKQPLPAILTPIQSHHFFLDQLAYRFNLIFSLSQLNLPLQFLIQHSLFP